MSDAADSSLVFVYVFLAAFVAMVVTAVVIFLADDLIAPFYAIFADSGSTLGTTGGAVVNPATYLGLMAVVTIGAPVAVGLFVFYSPFGPGKG